MEPDLPGLLVGRGGGPQVGAWFTGRNETRRTWETRSQVVAADPGRKFAWQVNNGWVHWEYTFEPEDGGTRLTESWEFLPPASRVPRALRRRRRRRDRKRHDAAKSGIPATLAAIKKAAEAKCRYGRRPEDLDLLGEPLEVLRTEAVEPQPRSR